MEDTT
jgi:hypothetical protein